MKKLLLVLSVILLAVTTGCRKNVRSATGEISLNLVSEGEFTPILKSAPDEVDINTFKVTITKKEDGSTINHWEKFSDMPSVVYIEPGSFSISAESPWETSVAWNQPLYLGTKDFKIEAGKVENVELVCKLSNMKVTVLCTESFIDELNDDFSIKVSNKNGFLIYNKEIIDQGEAVAGYFDVNPLTVDIKGTRKLDGSIVSHYFTVTDVAAQDHHIFTVDVFETGQVTLGGGNGISVDYTVNNKEVDILIGDLEEDPEEEDLSGTPSVEATTVAPGATVETTLGAIAVNYTLPVKLISNHGITLNSAPVTAVAQDKTIAITLETLAAGTDYVLSIPAGAVLNSYDDSPADAYTLSFKTQAEGEVEVPITIDVPGISEPAIINASTTTFDLNVTADEGIENLVFTIKSQAIIDMASGVGLTSPVDLANMTSAEEESWGSEDMLNVKSSDIKGKTQVSLKLGSLMKLLPFVVEAGEYKFHIKVVDKKNNAKENDIVINVVK